MVYRGLTRGGRQRLDDKFGQPLGAVGATERRGRGRGHRQSVGAEQPFEQRRQDLK